MATGDEVTQWIQQLASGNSEAANGLWVQYFDKLVAYARRKMQTMPRRHADEEDVALSAMKSFCLGMAEHRFDQLSNRQDLWKLLVTIAARKVIAQQRYDHAEKRGGGRVHGESIFMAGEFDLGHGSGIGAVLGREPTPELANLVAEDFHRLLDSLDDETLRQIALLTLEGYTVQEIAARLGCVRRTIERKLERIRTKWSDEGPRPVDSKTTA
jgi:RNA polymerase sigma factor (sigma-70 family)